MSLINPSDLFISQYPMLLSLIEYFGTKTLSEIDSQQLIRQRNRYVASYQKQDDLIRLISQRLLERLELVTIEPSLVVDLASTDGSACRQLKAHYRSARVLGVEPALKFCQHAKKQSGWFKKPHYLCALPDSLPLKDNCADLVVINLYPVWLSDVTTLFREINRILTDNGLILFTSMGPDSLNSVRESWQMVDPDFPHTMTFTDMHDIGDALTRTGFHNIVMENEPLTIKYSNTASLHDDLKKTGHANLAPERRRTLTGKQRYQRYLNHLQQQHENDFNITYDVIFGHGWKGIKQPKHAINAIPDQYDAIPVKSLD